MKTCSLCDKKAAHGGLCSKHASAAWRAAHPGYSAKKKAEWRARNPERANEIRRKWYWANREKALKDQAKWRIENREKWLAAAARYRREHPEQMVAWVKANPEKARANWRKNTLKRRSVERGHTGDQVQALLKKQRGRCPICKCDLPTNYHVDHIQPLAKGGTDKISNIQLLCPPCNQHKHARDPIAFMQSLGFLL